MKTLASSPDDNRSQENIGCTISRHGDLTITAVAQLTREAAIDYRYLRSVTRPDQVVSIYKQVTGDASPKTAKITSFTLANSRGLPSPDDPLTVKLGFTETGFVQTNSKAAYWFTAPYSPPAVSPAQLLNDIGRSDRRHSYIASPEKIEIIEVIKVPASFAVRLPTGVDVTNAVGDVHVEYTMNNTGEIVVDRRLEIDKPVIPPAQIGDLRALSHALVQDSNARVYLVPRAS